MSDATGQHTLVFVCGLHRSGTTQLAATLASHPDVSGMLGSGAPHDEGQHLQDVFSTARSHGGPGRFAFDAAAHLTENSPNSDAAAAGRLFAQWSSYWDLDRRVLVEKSPPNLIRMRYLQAMFPDARFVIIVRHPIVTMLATRKLATTKWMRRTFREASLVVTARHWFAAHRLLLDDLPRIRNTHLVRWEELCAEPQQCLDLVATFVGVDGHLPQPDLDPQVDERYRQEWTQLASAKPDGRMSELRRVLDANEELAGRFGYSLTDLRGLGPLNV